MHPINWNTHDFWGPRTGQGVWEAGLSTLWFILTRYEWNMPYTMFLQELTYFALFRRGIIKNGSLLSWDNHVLRYLPTERKCAKLMACTMLSQCGLSWYPTAHNVLLSHFFTKVVLALNESVIKTKVNGLKHTLLKFFTRNLIFSSVK